jgi:hypothetical protein
MICIRYLCMSFRRAVIWSAENELATFLTNLDLQKV